MTYVLVLIVLLATGCGAADRDAGSARDVAAADPVVAAALREGDVARVVERPAPGGGTAVAFVFSRPVEPARSPFDVVCDVAGQTRGWRGVAAVVADGAVQDASPIWLTGANCAGIEL